MAKGVERVVVIGPGAAGRDPSLQVVFKAKKKKRKRRSESLRWAEGLSRNAAQAASAGVDSYLKRHDRSNRRKRDGWLFDLPGNMWEAGLDGKRRIRVWNVW